MHVAPIRLLKKESSSQLKSVGIRPVYFGLVFVSWAHSFWSSLSLSILSPLKITVAASDGCCDVCGEGLCEDPTP